MAWFKCLVLASAAIPAAQSLHASSGSGLPAGAAADGASIYIEVAAPLGADVGALESQLLKKYSPGQNTYRLSEESRIAQDDAYKSLVLNSLGAQMDQTHDFCTKSTACIQSFIQSPATSAGLYAMMGRTYAESQSQGCLQVGGCKAEVFGTLNWHVEHGHNVLVESGLMDSKSVQERLTVVNRNMNYQKILVVVANKFQALSSKHAGTSAMSIQTFMADPKSQSAPVLIDPKNFSFTVQDFACTMHQMLECMPGGASTVGARPCEPKFDGVYVIDRTQGDENVAIAMKGCPRSDPGLQGANAALRNSLPPGTSMCALVHGLPTAQSLLTGFFR